MIALLQRVSVAKVIVDQKTVGKIEQGLLVFLGIAREDTQKKADRLLERVLGYRLFSDADDKMNLNVQDINGGLLIVSQFTLAAETNKGMRAGFSTAMEPSAGESLYDYFIANAKMKYNKIETGIYGAKMDVSLINDGPVTFILNV